MTTRVRWLRAGLGTALTLVMGIGAAILVALLIDPVWEWLFALPGLGIPVPLAAFLLALTAGIGGCVIAYRRAIRYAADVASSSPHPLSCPICRYDLDGVTAAQGAEGQPVRRCPECGTTIVYVSSTGAI